MSEPVSNAEIEDVLSSIRRLVSEEASPLHRRKEIAEAAKERFVLTPALRVTEEDQPAEPVAADAPEGTAGDAAPEDAVDDQPAPAPDPFAESRQTLEQRIAELEAALQTSTEEWEPDGSEVTGSAAPDMPSIADAPESPELQDNPVEANAPSDLAALDWSDVEEADPQTEGMADGPAEGMGDAVEIDFAEQTADLTEIVAEASQETVEDVLAVEPDVTDRAPNDQTGATVEAEEGEASELQVSDEQSDTSEADLSSSQADAPELEPALDPAPDADEAHSDPEPQTAPDDTAFEEDPQDADAEFELFEEASVLDEEALRDLVSQLVRDELQGVLGERITLNVRRLVRREIQRAIAMRELD